MLTTKLLDMIISVNFELVFGSEENSRYEYT